MAKREEKHPAAVELGRRGGLKGGRARAETLTPEQRSDSARKAVLARWKKACKPITGSEAADQEAQPIGFISCPACKSATSAVRAPAQGRLRPGGDVPRLRSPSVATVREVRVEADGRVVREVRGQSLGFGSHRSQRLYRRFVNVMRLLREYVAYYHADRTHLYLSLEGTPPTPVPSNHRRIGGSLHGRSSVASTIDTIVAPREQRRHPGH